MVPRKLLPMLVVPLLLVACATFQQGPSDQPVPKDAAFVQVGDWRVHVRREGDHGPWLLLVHGYSSTHLEWLAVAPALCAEHRCLLVDIPGFGWSDKKAGDYSPAHLAAVLVKVLDHYRVEQAHVVAHSWGASLALAMALDAPERITTLTLVGAWVYYEQLPSLMKWARVPGLGEFLFTAFFDQQPEMRYEQVYYEPDKHVRASDIDLMKRFLKREGVVRAALQAARDQRLEDQQERYPDVTLPTLLIWGSEDMVSYPYYGHRLDADMPNSTYREMPRCGHVPHHEDPAGFVRLVLPFLATHETGDSPPARTAAGGGERP